MKRWGEELHGDRGRGPLPSAEARGRGRGEGASRRNAVEACGVARLRVPHPKDHNPQSAPRVMLSQPREVAFFSKYEGDMVEFSRSNLLRYREPEVGVDLLEGIESYTPKDESDPSAHPAPLAPLLASLDHFHQHLTRPPQFVTYRNNLNKILGTPYNTSNPWTLCVERKDGCFYLDVRRTAEELECNGRPMPSNQANALFSGRRFELYATDPRSSTENVDSKRRVNQDEEYCGVFALNLGEKRLVVAAEIDCYDGYDESTDSYAYVELKTTRVLQTDKDRYVFERFKLLSFWIQSYIVGTPRIVCGFRDDNFELRKLQTFKTTDIPSFCRKYWDPQVCLRFAGAVLQWISDTAVEGRVYAVSYYPREHQLEMTELHGEPSLLRGHHRVHGEKM